MLFNCVCFPILALLIAAWNVDQRLVSPLHQSLSDVQLSDCVRNWSSFSFPHPFVEISVRDVLLERIQSLAPPFPEFNPEFERVIRFTAAISRAHLIGPILGRINAHPIRFKPFWFILEDSWIYYFISDEILTRDSAPSANSQEY